MNSFNSTDLDSLGIIITKHDAFKLPDAITGIFQYTSKHGGLRTYTQYKERQFNLSINLDNGATPETDIRSLLRLFYTTEPKPLIFDDRADRYIDCIINGAIDYSDSLGFTNFTIPMVAPFPFFESLEEQVVTVSDTLTFEGDAPPSPLIQLLGPITNPYVTITNQLGSFLLTYTGILSSADVLNINLKTGLVLFNSSNAAEYVTSSGLVITTGANLITSNTTIQVRYRETWL